MNLHCDICIIKFNNKAAFDCHCNHAHGKMYTLKFMNVSSLKQETIHHEEPKSQNILHSDETKKQNESFPCSLRNATFSRKGDMTSHVTAVH